MNVQEISDRFDESLKKSLGGILIDEYNKSLYLTKAQAFFVRNLIKDYEYTDESRHLLAPLLVTSTLTATDFSIVDDYSRATVNNNEIMSVVFERLNNTIPLIPLDYNDIHYTLENPFRKPDKNIAYRVTMNGEFRIYTDQTISNYKYIYCRYPKPIVLIDITGTGLEIEGETTVTTSDLSNDSVLKIIEIAVEYLKKDINNVRSFTQEAPQE